jgi:hypothetical protein
MLAGAVIQNIIVLLALILCPLHQYKQSIAHRHKLSMMNSDIDAN